MLPNINGVAYSHSSITIMIPELGETIIGAESLSYSDDCEPGLLYGTMPGILGRTAGQYKPEGQIVLWRQQFDELISKLPREFGIYSYDWIITYGDYGMPTKTDTLVGVRLIGNGVDSSQGNEGTKMTVKLSIFGIAWNGKTITFLGF